MGIVKRKERSDRSARQPGLTVLYLVLDLFMESLIEPADMEPVDKDMVDPDVERQHHPLTLLKVLSPGNSGDGVFRDVNVEVDVKKGQIVSQKEIKMFLGISGDRQDRAPGPVLRMCCFFP